jgi:hypothetical protein
VDWPQLFGGLQFHDDRVLYEEIEAQATRQPNAFVSDGQLDLALESEPPKSELATKTLLVHRLEQAWSKASVHLNRSSDDASSNLFI